jgi:GTP cyclohydrolase FolE2
MAMGRKIEVQDQPASEVVEAGISNLRVMYKCRNISIPLNLTMTVPTKKRGVHMSRLVGAILRNSNGSVLEDALRSMCREVDSTQGGCRVRAELQYPIEDQFMEIILTLCASGPINYTFGKYGITSCPCSREECGIGHMQRSYLEVSIKSEHALDFLEVAGKLDSCFSATLSEHLRRHQEVTKIMEAQGRPRFVEDLVRECHNLFPESDRIEARSLESIHSHDAIAYWTR